MNRPGLGRMRLRPFAYDRVGRDGETPMDVTTSFRPAVFRGDRVGSQTSLELRQQNTSEWPVLECDPPKGTEVLLRAAPRLGDT
jgi:hypothetical protein